MLTTSFTLTEMQNLKLKKYGEHIFVKALYHCSLTMFISGLHSDFSLKLQAKDNKKRNYAPK